MSTAAGDCAAVLEAVQTAVSPSCKAVAVAFSGGVDSTVLLWALAASREVLDIGTLRALHVHHGLHEQADAWEMHCARVASELGVPFRCLRVDATPNGQGPQAAARQARYAALAGELAPAERLCVAHHADDQVETFLIQLLRGAGPRALSAMPAQRALGPGVLLRPLLPLTRTQIQRCARSRRLRWVDDPSNRHEHYLRTRVRSELLPLMRDMRPGIDDVLQETARRQAEAAALMRVTVEQDRLRANGAVPGTLSRRALAALAPERRRALLVAWLSEHGVGAPPSARLKELERQCVRDSANAHVRMQWPGAEVRSHGDSLHWLNDDARRRVECGRWNWDATAPFALRHGVLSADKVVGGGLRIGKALELRVGERGLRCQPAGDARPSALKEVLRRRGIVPWERRTLPVLYVDGALAAVADLFICEGFQASDGEPGLSFRWRKH